jgi:NAD-dependent deacetylase sirtuin 5
VLVDLLAAGAAVQNLDDAVLDRIDAVLDHADLLLIVGTSSVVYPAAGYAPQVAQRCAAAVSHTRLHCSIC